MNTRVESPLKTFAFVLIAALMAAACTAPAPPAANAPAPTAASAGGAAAPTSAPAAAAATSAPAPTAAGAAAGQAAAGQPTATFTLGVLSDPQTLDPAVATDLPGRLTLVNLYEPLIKYAGKPAKPEPLLADSITGSADSKSYTVKLKPNIKFHDGSPLNAAAVAFTMDRVLAMGKGGAAPFKDLLKVGSTKVVDDLTVQFNLESPSAVFPGTLSFFFIVNPAVINANKQASGAYGDNGDYGETYLQSHDAGSGPYTITARTPNADITMQAYPGYWRGWKANQYGTFVYKIVGEPATASLSLKQGVVDGVYETYPTSVFDDLAKDPNVVVHTDQGIKPFYIFLNNKKTPTDDVRVRQAIAYAFDYNQALNIAPGSTRLPGPLPTTMLGSLQTPMYETNLDKAKQLLSDAGVQPGTVTLDYGTLAGPASNQTKVGLLLQDGLSKIGIGLEITNYAWADILAQTTKPETTKSAYAIQLAADYADPDALLFQGWATAGHGSWSGAQWYTNQKVDDLIAQGRSTADPAQRQQIYDQAQQQIVQDSSGVFMMNLPIQVALTKSVGGYNFEVSYYNYQVYNLFKQ
jgi:peptide/nickel transport system substrate-binding protein